jgi:ankyrin repeat protein
MSKYEMQWLTYLDIPIKVLTHIVEHYCSIAKLIRFCCEHNNALIIDILHEAGHKFDFDFGNGERPIHVACRCISADVVIKLVDYDCRIDQQDSTGCLPLHHVIGARTHFFHDIEENRTKLVKLLIESSITDHVLDINCANQCGDTLLTLACGNENVSRFGVELIKLLLDNGANPYIKNKDGNTAFHLVCMLSPLWINTFHILMKHHNGSPQINHLNNDGLAPLHLAVQANNCGAIECLLKTEGVDRERLSADGVKPAMMATDYHDMTLVKLFI